VYELPSDPKDFSRFSVLAQPLDNALQEQLKERIYQSEAQFHEEEKKLKESKGVVSRKPLPSQPFVLLSQVCEVPGDLILGERASGGSFVVEPFGILDHRRTKEIESCGW